MLAEYSAECVVIGAGVVGLAVAREMALAGYEVLVLEAESLVGSHTSSRNSEVIHAGIYYPQGSLKARMCVQGKALLYRYCTERGIAHKRCGKLIVATQAGQQADLKSIKARAEANGVMDLRELSCEDVMALEPDITCIAALYSPSTGIIDSHALMVSFQGDIEQHGGTVLLRSPVTGGEIDAGSLVLEVGGSEPARLRARYVINCGGLFASAFVRNLRGFPANKQVPTYYAKGNYFSVTGRTNFQRLIYPVPEHGGLGVHLTLDMAGNARFGPDVEWVDEISYPVDAVRGDRFYNEIRKYWPALPDNSLAPAYSGVRPKLTRQQDKLAADFMIQMPADHGVSGLCNLFGIESPGLTSSLAIAGYVRSLF